MKRIERVVVEECIGQTSPLPGQLRSRLGDQPIKFVFLATEHPGIPDIEILDKLLDARTALLTQDRVLHNLAIGRDFRSFVHTSESGLTERRLAHVSAVDKYLPVSSGAHLKLVCGTPGERAESSVPAWEEGPPTGASPPFGDPLRVDARVLQRSSPILCASVVRQNRSSRTSPNSSASWSSGDRQNLVGIVVLVRC